MNPDDLWRGLVVLAVLIILNLIPWAIQRLSRKDPE